jgi:formate-dependent phosphoribosylglycinamide formyltransferase (GAR transformylase)
MGVALARAGDIDSARKLARRAADCVTIRYE